MNDNQDRLMDQMIEEAARKNGPPDLRAKIMAAASNKAAPRATGKLIALPRRRARVLPFAITAIAALLVITVLANIDFVRELVTRANNGTSAPSASSGPEGNKQPNEPQTNRAPSVSEGPAVPPSNEPPKEPHEETPKPVQPKPDEVKKPQTPPEERKPEERKPDGEVEQPRKPEESTPPQPKEAVVIAGVLGKPKLKLRYAETESWSEFDGATLKSGVHLQARGNVDLTLTSGALLRFDGEVVLMGDGKGIESSIIKEALYFDNRGCNQPLSVVSKKFHAELKDGAAMFSASSTALEITCLDGEVQTHAGIVAEGTIKRLTERGLSAAKPFSMDRTLADLPLRVIEREDFEKEPAGGLYGGRIEGGVALAKGNGEYVAFRHNPTLTLMPRMAVKMRLRVSNAKRLQLEIFEQGGNDQPWLIHLTPEQGDFVTVTVKFDELRLREKPDARLSADTLLRNFKLYVEGEKDASLEIDWVEFVRLGPGE